tara:strand:- start:1282 stop:1575 length:294 start_codon:yes stop_codon:yes gene_type:complete
MYLVPLIRANRAIAASLIYPEHPIQAIAISELSSVIIPILNPDLFPRILGTIIAAMYQPYFAHYYIKKYHELNNIHNEAEICSLLLFIFVLGFQYIK